MPFLANLTSDLKFTPTTRIRRDGSIAEPGESSRNLTNVSTSDFSANPIPYEVAEEQNDSPLSNNFSQLRYVFDGPPPSRNRDSATRFQVGEPLESVNNATPSEYRKKTTDPYPVTRNGDPFTSPLLQPIKNGLGKVILQSEYRNIQPSGLASGKQPYIWTSVPGFKDPNPTLGFGPDIFGRAGYIEAALTDVERLAKWGADSFNTGALYTLKQTSLALTAPKTLGSPNRIYNPANTLAQIAAGAISGVHFNRLGLLPIQIDPNDKYEGKLRNEFNGDGEEGLNRLTALKKLKLNGETMSLLDAARLDVNRGNEGMLLSYISGPNSVLGVGRTRIRRYEYTEEWNNTENNPTPTVLALTYNQLDNTVTLSKNTGTGLAGINNFAALINNNSNATDELKRKRLGRIANYQEFNRTKTYGTGDPSGQNLDRVAYYEEVPTTPFDPNGSGIDFKNYQRLFSTDLIENTVDNDIIKFHFKIIDNDKPQRKVYVGFRAYLTNFSDNHQAEWNTFKYMGRGETFRRYQGYDRSISLGFKVHVGSRSELFPVYEKLNYLASAMAPDYSGGGFMRGNIIEMTVGDYLNNVPGIVDNVEYQFPEDAPWEIARKDDGSEDKNSAQLPTLVEVSMDFKPIHSFLPRTVKANTIDERYGGATDNIPESQFISMGSENRGYKPYTE